MAQLPASIEMEAPSSQKPWLLPEDHALSMFYGCPEIPRLSHYFLPKPLSEGHRVLYLDGANRFDPLLIARFTRERGQDFNSLIRVARAFTCFQLTELVERVPMFLRQFSAHAVIVTAIPDLYFDQDIRDSIATASFDRAIKALHRLKQYPVSVAVFTGATASQSPQRTFFQRLVLQTDHLIRIEQIDDRVTFASGIAKQLR